MRNEKTVHLAAGDMVVTSCVGGEDFGLPLVTPNRGTRNRHYRTVRNAVKCQGGTVVWFTDGTKTPPINGRTVWYVVEDPTEMVTAKPAVVAEPTVARDWYEYLAAGGARHNRP